MERWFIYDADSEIYLTFKVRIVKNSDLSFDCRVRQASALKTMKAKSSKVSNISYNSLGISYQTLFQIASKLIQVSKYTSSSRRMPVNL